MQQVTTAQTNQQCSFIRSDTSNKLRRAQNTTHNINKEVRSRVPLALSTHSVRILLYRERGAYGQRRVRSDGDDVVLKSKVQSSTRSVLTSIRLIVLDCGFLYRILNRIIYNPPKKNLEYILQKGTDENLVAVKFV